VNSNVLNNINKRVSDESDPQAKQVKEDYKKKEEAIKEVKQVGQDIKEGVVETTKKIKENVENTGAKIKEGIENTTNTIKSTLGIETAEKKPNELNNKSDKKSKDRKRDSDKNSGNDTMNSNKNTTSATEVILKIFKYILITAVVVGVATALWYYYKNVYLSSGGDMGETVILDKAKQGDIPLVISQDPDSENHVKILQKSEGQPGGIEFTYSFWIVISDLEKKGEWKHIFHKGNKSSFPNRAPGVWLHPDKNDLRIYLNSIGDPLTYLDVEQIPMKKWVNVTMIYTETLNNNDKSQSLDNIDKRHVLDVFINGMLKKTKSFENKMQSNDGDFWINMFNGFNGLLAKIKYFGRSITIDEVQRLANDCPNDATCGIDADCPPYLDTQWWFS